MQQHFIFGHSAPFGKSSRKVQYVYWIKVGISKQTNTFPCVRNRYGAVFQNANKSNDDPVNNSVNGQLHRIIYRVPMIAPTKASAKMTGTATTKM